MLSALIGFWLILILPGSAPAQITMSQSADRSAVAFEEQVTFEITLSWPGPTLAYIFEKPFRVESDKLKVASFSSSLTSTGLGPDEITSKTFTYLLTPTLSGEATIAPIIVEYLTWPDSTVGRLHTDPVRIQIATPLQVEIETEEESLGLWVIIAGAFLALFVAGGVWFRRKPSAEVNLSPAEEFVVRLDALSEESGGDLKRFQRGIYRELIEYLQAAFGIELSSQTPAERKVLLQQSNLNAIQQKVILDWLERAEREKYSPVAAQPGATVRLHSELKSFFEKL